MPKYIIYQLLPRTFANDCENRRPNGTIEDNGCGKFNAITPKALRAIRQLGATHVWYTGVLEHATQTDYSAYHIAPDAPQVVKGKAGSPYAVKDFYDVDPDLAEDVPHRMQEFEALLQRTHKAGLKVVMDFVPNHVARQYHSDCLPEGQTDLGEHDNPDWAFSPLNNFYYLPGQALTPRFDVGSYHEYPAKVTGNDCFTASPSITDWYETVKLNYGVFYQGGGEKQFDPIPDTWHKMLAVLLFWAKKGVDAFRCDMAEMVPVEFWKWAIEQVKAQYPNLLFLGEVYNPALYHSFIHNGFDLLYDKVGMYDYLRGVTSRDYPAYGITHQWQNTDTIRSQMLYFLENHDEQRIASGFFCGSGICAEPAAIVMTLLGDNPVMIYAGQELGEKGMDAEGFSGIDGKTTIFDYWGVRSLQAWANHGRFDGAHLSAEQKELRAFYATLLNLATREKAVALGQMFDLVYAQNEGFNKNKQYAFLRYYEGELLLVVVNFDAHTARLQVQIPQDAFAYLEMPSQESLPFTDLLTGQTLTASWQPNHAVSLEVPAWKGVVLKATLHNASHS